ncbi:hypothetical protein M405DRAFT_817043, partial [Rhizopogon salebrosus TDB-379]
MTQQVTLNCLGCKQSVVNESGATIIYTHGPPLTLQFRRSFFHVDCFKCAKCHQKVAVDTKLVLLSDGSPICTNCSYDCNVCHQPILDEAIMTGDDTYHVHCFNCKACHNRIDELVFAKTRSAIYCMTCHYKRMAKIVMHNGSMSDQSQAALSRRKCYDDSVQPDHSSMGTSQMAPH